jgi:hypothetical protein
MIPFWQLPTALLFAVGYLLFSAGLIAQPIRSIEGPI